MAISPPKIFRFEFLWLIFSLFGDDFQDCLHHLLVRENG